LSVFLDRRNALDRWSGGRYNAAFRIRFNRRTCTMKASKPSDLAGVWSASPTPFTDKMKVDKASIRRMVEHHVKLGVKGLFLAGTCGEGPAMKDDQRRELIETTARWAKGKLAIAVQVTDNSAARMLENIRMVKDCGGEIAVIAPPYFVSNRTPQHIAEIYLDTIRNSPLPVGIYDRGQYSPVLVPDEVIKTVYSEPRVILAKDSSADEKRRKLALAVRKKRQDLTLLSGWEFNCVPYIRDGYDGLLLGGGIFNGRLAQMIIEAVHAGEIDQADRLQLRMNKMMWDVYGGKDIRCWLSGQKKLLVEMGVFSTWKSYCNYPLTEACQKKIKQVMKREADVLFPWR